jgi:dTDP-4-amino-4,6-dideoxy-D-glucose acyltransferase
MIKSEEYLTSAEVAELGLAACGKQVFISRRAVLAHPQCLHIGDSVRIDAYCSIIGRGAVHIGDYVHIGSSVTISAGASVKVGSFSGIASGARLFTSDDDYSGAFLTGPTVPPEMTHVEVAPIELGCYTVIGSNSVVLPTTVLEDGAVIGALSLARGRYPGWAIYGGVPAKRLKSRTQEAAEKADAIRKDNGKSPLDGA